LKRKFNLGCGFDKRDGFVNADNSWGEGTAVRRRTVK
jgi:hypothetical protein